LRLRGQRQHLTAGAVRNAIDHYFRRFRFGLNRHASHQRRQLDLDRLFFVGLHLHLALGRLVSGAGNADVVSRTRCERHFERRLSSIGTVQRHAGTGGFRRDRDQPVGRLEFDVRQRLILGRGDLESACASS
jgi:hypothetical protein